MVESKAYVIEHCTEDHDLVIECAKRRIADVMVEHGVGIIEAGLMLTLSLTNQWGQPENMKPIPFLAFNVMRAACYELIKEKAGRDAQLN